LITENITKFYEVAGHVWVGWCHEPFTWDASHSYTQGSRTHNPVGKILINQLTPILNAFTNTLLLGQPTSADSNII